MKTDKLYIKKNFITMTLLDEESIYDAIENNSFSGNYNDLGNKPPIPSKISDLTNDSDFISTSSTSGLVKNDGTIDTNSYLTLSSISGKEDSSNKVTSITSSSTDTEYPSAKAVYTAIQSGGGSVVVVDNLITDDGTKALSARQGKVLNDLIGDAITYINQ